MSVTRNVLRGVLRSVTGSVVRAGVISRYFTFLDRSASQYYSFVQGIVLAGDFDIEFEFFTTYENNKILMGDHHLTTYYFGVDDNSFDVWSAGSVASFSFGGATPLDGKLHKIRYILSGISISAILDGISLGSRNIVPYTGVNNFIIGNSNGIQAFWDGGLANVSISGDGIQPIQLKLNENFGVTSIGVNSAPGTIGTYGNVTAQNISTDSPFYTLNAAGTLWTSPDGPDLEVAT